MRMLTPSPRQGERSTARERLRFSSLSSDVWVVRMNSITRSLAKTYFEQGIRTNAVAPGWVDTKMVREYREINDRAEDPHGTPEQIANVVLFLASELASYVTGVYLPVCGGNEMPGI